MGARLAYLKVIDRQLFYDRGARIQPGLNNLVVLREEPGPAAAFLVLRGWTDDHGTFTEQWRIESPGGERVFESVAREIHLASKSHLEKLEDELVDIDFEYSADNYTVVLTLDDNEVARADFVVRTNEERSA